MKYLSILIGLASLLTGCASTAAPARVKSLDPTNGGKRKVVVFRKYQKLTDPSQAMNSFEAVLQSGITSTEFNRRIDSIFFSTLMEDAKVAHLSLDTVTACDSLWCLPALKGWDTLKVQFPARLPNDTDLFLAISPMSFILGQKIPSDTSSTMLMADTRYALYDPKIHATVADGKISVSSHHLFGHSVDRTDWYTNANKTAYQLISRLLEFH